MRPLDLASQFFCLAASERAFQNMPLSAYIVSNIQAAGLEQYARKLQALDDQQFLSMLMSDYSTYGVVDVEDKQRLFRSDRSDFQFLR